MHEMQGAVKVRVEHGQLVLDGPAALPEGSRWKLVALDSLDEEMSAAERAELEEAIEEGYRDIENGDVVDGVEFAEQLLANTK
jgi:hypothetical protein